MRRSLFISTLAIAFMIASGATAEIVVSNAWIRTPVGQANTTAAYVTLHNDGSTDDRLIAAAVAGVIKTEVHRTTTSEDGVMRMRPADRLSIPAGQTVSFKSGADHLMLVGLTRPLQTEDQVPLTLTFENGGEVTVDALVARRNPFP